MPQLSIDHVTRAVGNQQLLSDLNVIIDDNEFLVFLGSPGCGNMTVLRLIAGLEEVSQGRIEFNSTVINPTGRINRGILELFGALTLQPELTVFENLALPLYPLNLSENEINKRVLGAAQLLGMFKYLKYKLGQITPGQKSRVSFGQAILTQKPIILINNCLPKSWSGKLPFSYEQIKKIHQAYPSLFIYAGSNPMEAVKIATKIVVLDKGVLQQSDSPENIYIRPNNVFVAKMFGSPAMNFFDVVIRKSDKGLSVKANSFSIKLPPDNQAWLKPYQGKRLILGIRPEDIYHPDCPPDSNYGAEIDIKVEATQLLSGECIHFMLSGKDRFIARMDPECHFPLGEKVQVILDLDRIHLFDPSLDQENPPRIPCP
jgi:multiple sugar transport system ATP-binding protein